MPLRNPDAEPALPDLRTFVVQRTFTEVVNGRTIRSPHLMLEEELLAHNLSVEDSGALVLVELADVGDGKAQVQYRRIFAPGTWFAVTEKIERAGSVLVN